MKDIVEDLIKKFPGAEKLIRGTADSVDGIYRTELGNILRNYSYIFGTKYNIKETRRTTSARLPHTEKEMHLRAPLPSFWAAATLLHIPKK